MLLGFSTEDFSKKRNAYPKPPRVGQGAKRKPVVL
jgi:hypothetical protein